MPSRNGVSHEVVLQKLHAAIDMPDEIRDWIVAKYQSLGEWLDRERSELKPYEPFVAPQGSQLLGTANRPFGAEEEYDVDLICRLLVSKAQVTQKDLKAAVGREVKGYALAHDMSHRPKEKQRCWHLPYAEDHRFHLDILPCIPDADRYQRMLIESGHGGVAGNLAITKEAIAITDKTDPNYERLTEDWPTSNPLGFAAWFFEQMAERLLAEKYDLMGRVSDFASVEDIPNHLVKTTLQKVIQLLKRHRDTMFTGDPDHKPISMIITTLSALAYGNEGTLVGALTSILQTMDTFIEKRKGITWIANPVNPEENFADKWGENPEKEHAFRRWLLAARKDFGAYLNGARPEEVPQTLRNRLGEKTVDQVLGAIKPKKITAPSIVTASATSRVDAMAVSIRDRGTGTRPWRRND